MPRISGIITTRDANKRLHKITIDLKKHPEAIAPLIELGLITDNPMQQHAILNGYVTVEAAKKQTEQHIREVWPK